MVWEGGERTILGPANGDPTGDVRPVEVVVDHVSANGVIVPRFNMRVAVDHIDLEALRMGGHLWVSTLGCQMPPVAVGLAPSGVPLGLR